MKFSGLKRLTRADLCAILFTLFLQERRGRVGRVQAVTIQNTPRPIDVSAMNSPAA